MTRKEHLEFCRKCTHRKTDIQQGIICRKTNEKADFEISCEHFTLDETVPNSISAEVNTEAEFLAELPEPLIQGLRAHQHLGFAIVGGLFLSIICALLWAVITVTTEYQIGYMAIGVGFVVGYGIRFFGAGIDPVFGILGGFFALLGCLLGNLFSQVGFIANEQFLGYLETLTLLDFETIIQIYTDSFSPIDLLFYAIAVYEGYKFAFRTVPVNIEKLNDLTPEYSKLRLPLVVVCLVILVISGFSLSQGTSGEKKFFYEDGSIQSRGELKDGLENGEWSYFYPSGELQLIANYVEGKEDGVWEWHYESGQIMQRGFYKSGLYHGTWLYFHQNGVLKDSSNYSVGRLQGEFKSYFENGTLAQIGEYNRDKQIGEWKTFYENGNLNAQGSFKAGEFAGLWKFWNLDGTPSQEITYAEDGNVRITNAWDESGKQMVKDGEGFYIAYYEGKNKQLEGKVEQGMKTGIWKTYYLNGSIFEIGEHKDDVYLVQSTWTPKGEAAVLDGNGAYTSYTQDIEFEFEKGEIKNGLREGVWLTYYPGTKDIQVETNYKNGKLHGRSVNFSPSGTIVTEGNFELDKKVGEWKWYYESGQLQCTITYVKDKKVGDQIFWSESGKEAKKEIYKNGELVSETLL